MDVLSPLQQEGTATTVGTWHRAVGDLVQEGDPLVELETDKVALEVASPVTGRVAAILVASGSVEPGALLAQIEPEAAAPASPRSADSMPAQTEEFAPELRLSPAVRKLLRETGLDPAGIPGSGKDGRLTRDDVVQANARRDEAPTPAAQPSRIPHDSMRRRIAEHMARSVATAPHVTAVFEADLGAIMAHRRAHQVAFAAQGAKLTLTAYFVQAAVAAMRAAPAVNSRWHEDGLELFAHVNIGIGTALGDRGLIVPVIEGAEGLSLLGIATRLDALTARARDGRLTPADVQGGTFTISNHGTSGSLIAAPIIINQPQSAILGIGRVEKRVVVREIGGTDAILIRPMAYVSLTIDHRAIDGAQTNAWLTRFVATLESWPVE